MIVPLAIAAGAILLLSGGRRGNGARDPTLVGVTKVQPGGAPAGWRNTISDQGLAVAEECLDRTDTLSELRDCMAESLFPAVEWPPVPDSPQWQHDAWVEINRVAHIAMGLDPPIA